MLFDVLLLAAISIIAVMFLLGWLLILMIDEKTAEKRLREEIEDREDIESMPDMYRRD